MKVSRVAAAIVILILSAVAGWAAGTRVHSPADAAARSAPPNPSPILVPVEERVLSSNVITRGTGRPGPAREIWLASSHVKSGPRVMTSTSTEGAVLSEGDVAMTVSARPVFILQGAIPTFRDLGPGADGADVRQLESALSRLGFDAGPVDGCYDAMTGDAVAAMYRRAGYATAITMNVGAPDATAGNPSCGSLVQAVDSPVVPADEVVFMPEMPVRVSDTIVPVGAPVEGPVMTLTDTTIAVDAVVPLESASLIGPGMGVGIDEPDLGIATEGVVDLVAEGPGSHGADGYHVYFHVSVPDAPGNLLDASVRLTIPVATTGGPVLSVPLSALSMGPDGASRVERSNGDSLEYVSVEPGMAADGFVAVTVVSGSLRVGDLVSIGTALPTP